MQADFRAETDRGHGLALGEHLGVRADADLQILRPGVARDQRLLQFHGRFGAGHDLREILADQFVQLRADLARLGRIATGLFLDHALQEADRERHASRLDRRQIDRREQALARVGFQRLSQPVAYVAEFFSGRTGRDIEQVVAIEQVRHGRPVSADVEEFATTYGDQCRTVDGRCAPDAADQYGAIEILGKTVGKFEQIH